ncbi:tRNA (adenine(22)-N(1))-methyltransferase [Thalassorhabdus alkalitolerans]|uniref:tRNA (Adenine(22)-N(1))-methyltransferase n=2 Tax=Thalassorhabdus alkalitolerans TaxID=2282697 RepID=A0ABW0YPX9_9BACI
MQRKDDLNMNKDVLSKRLQFIADEVQEGAVLADIGTDHGYLPVYLCSQGKIKKAIAGDVNEGPLEAAKNQIETSHCGGFVIPRLGSGLSVIKKEDNIDTIVIAGMGGSLISAILEEGKEKLPGVKRLILQPNIHALYVREWLLKEGWEIKNEHILEEDNRIYEIIVAECGEWEKPYQDINKEAALLLGPFLLKERNDAFIKKWSRELNNWRRVLRELEKASDENRITARKEEVERKIKLTEEVLS